MPREGRAGNPDRNGRPAPSRRDQARPNRPSDRAPSGRPHASRPVPPRPAAARPASARAAAAQGRVEPAAATRGGTLRGHRAVLGVFLVTLVGAGIDSFVGMGLGMITLVALLGSTAVAALLVRRGDLFSVVVAPPLVFIGVAAVNIALAPSASFNLPTVATLLIRGFPTMAMATGVALAVAVGRAIARR